MIASRSVMSARSKWVTWGIRVAESVMRSAMVRRRCESGARSTGPHCSKRGSGGASRPTLASGLAGPAGLRAGRRPSPAPRRPVAPRPRRARRRRVTRPPGPVPRTALRSTPSSRARRRVEGVAATGPSARAAAAGPAWERRGRGGVRAGAGRGRLAAGAVGAGALRLGAGAAAGSARRIGERDERRADLDGLAGRHVDLLHAPAHGRGDLDLRLVGLDLEERRVFPDDVALAHEDRDDLGLGQAFSKVWEAKRRGIAHLERKSLAAGVDDPGHVGQVRPSRGRSPRRARRGRSRAGSAPRATGRRPP